MLSLAMQDEEKIALKMNVNLKYIFIRMGSSVWFTFSSFRFLDPF